MGNEICIISIGDGWLDDDYTFYDDGKIRHFYDQHPTKNSITKWLKPDEINEEQKKQILAKCPSEYKFQIESMFLS